MVVSGGCLIRRPTESTAGDSRAQWTEAGELASLRDRVLKWMNSGTSDRTAVICADRGFDHARRLGLVPDLVVGDFDSISADAKSALDGMSSRIEVHPQAKNATDTEIAVDRAIALGATHILLLGALGGRVDHEMSNILMLAKLERLGVHSEILDNICRIMLIAAGHNPTEAKIQASRGDKLTLLPLSAACVGVTLQGLQYPLYKATLQLGTSRGVSNVFVEEEATISLDNGLLLAILTFANKC